jgi:hypothetical protein
MIAEVFERFSKSTAGVNFEICDVNIGGERGIRTTEHAPYPLRGRQTDQREIRLHLHHLLCDRRFTGNYQLHHGGPPDELVKIVPFNTRIGLSINEGKIGALELGEELIPADFFKPGVGRTEIEK